MAWDISALSYDSKSFTPVASGTLDLQAMALKPDGTELYVLNEAGSWPIIDQHTLSTPFDISTAGASIGASTASALNPHSNSYPGTLWFKPDGLKLFTINHNTGTNNTEIWEAPLGTAWDITTLSATEVIFDVTSLVGDFAWAAHMSQDGEHLYTQEGNVGTAFDSTTIHQWDLATAWDISSSADASKNFSPSAQLTGAQNIYFGNLGKSFIINSNTGVSYQYVMSTPYDISTASYDSKTYALAGDVAGISNASDLWIDPCSTKFYMMGNNGGTGDQTIYQWDLGLAGGCFNATTVTRVSKVVGEAIMANEPENRVTLLAGEVLTQSTPFNRVSQITGEVVYTTDPPNRVSLIALEVIANLTGPKIIQVAAEVITNINPVNTQNLQLCMPGDEVVFESFTTDEGPVGYPVDMITGGATIEPDSSYSDDVIGAGALDFNGLSWMRVLNFQPDFSGDFTIEFWVYKNSAGANEDIMGQWPEDAPAPGTDIGWRIRFFGANRLDFQWTSDGTTGTITTQTITYNEILSEWHHLVFESFNGIFTVYEDGLPIYNVASFGPIYQSSADFLVGLADRYGNIGNSFDGAIDEFRITTGEATFKAPFVPTRLSVDCVTVVLDISWDPGSLGSQIECSFSEFQIIVEGIETVQGTQEFQATGLPAGMSIDAFGNIIGHLPTHTAPPTNMVYEFEVTFYNEGVPLLGPDTWSFTVQNVYDQDILQVTTPSLFEGEDRIAWRTSLLGLIEFPDIFRVTDPNFGIVVNPDLFIINGLTEDTLLNWQNAVSREDGKGPAKHEVLIKTLKLAEGNPNFDVLYYSIEDPGSTVLSFENPLNAARELGVLPDPIEPTSIDNIRDLLIATVGFDPLFGVEVLPTWLETAFEPLIVAAYVTKGKGQTILNKFNSDAVHHAFKGRVIKIDRLEIRRCSTLWAENGEPEIIIKFDDVE